MACEITAHGRYHCSVSTGCVPLLLIYGTSARYISPQKRKTRHVSLSLTSETRARSASPQKGKMPPGRGERGRAEAGSLGCNGLIGSLRSGWCRWSLLCKWEKTAVFCLDQKPELSGRSLKGVARWKKKTSFICPWAEQDIHQTSPREAGSNSTQKLSGLKVAKIESKTKGSQPLPVEQGWKWDSQLQKRPGLCTSILSHCFLFF